MLRKILQLLILLFVANLAMATHNRAGEITYEQIGPLTIRATITTYTKTSSIQADRDSLDLNWGDGTFTRVGRTVKVFLQNDIQFNQYIAEHTYPGNSVYFLSMIDPNRNGGILNVNFPFSDQVQFFLQTEVHFLDQQFQGPNSSPILLQRPVDMACTGKVFQHTPNAWDPDGDSIAYELVVPLQSLNNAVPNYQTVDLISPGPNNQYTFDPVTGLFTWDAPQQPGEYNIAMLVKSYRNGVLIGTILRDMQILVVTCQNEPPVIEAPDELCVVAGETVDFEVTASDQDNGQEVRITATGGPFQMASSPAQLINVINPGNPAIATFRWNVSCDHIQDQYYQVAFKAEDNEFDTSGLAAFAITRIKVVGPPPVNVTATALPGEVRVCWDAPYPCASSTLFRGFTVWRKNSCSPHIPDSCTTGLDQYGYTRISPRILVSSNGQYCFSDFNVQRGGLYTYAVQAEFAPVSAGGFPFNAVSGLPSLGVCVQLALDIPLITNADVNATDAANGEVLVRWSKPKADDLDTLLNPGPYHYILYRGSGFTGANTQLADYVSANFADANDTTFTDTGLNTIGGPYCYRVEFKVQEDTLLGSTFTASTVYLQVTPTDQANNLRWSSNVPWGNYRYDIYRKDPGGTVFDSIASVIDTLYTDAGLINGETYCYYVRAVGTYSIDGILDPLINRSQEVCAIPRDNVAPCPPPFTATGCDANDAESDPSLLFNTLNWTSTGDCADDIERFRIYYSLTPAGPYAPVGEVLRSETPLFTHQPSIENLAGCYYITAIDSVENIGVPSGGNESLPGDTICVDNCPLYELPNAFTPNQDGNNETFRPFTPYRYIESVDFAVFNRWGEKLFSTSDPDLGWDGKDQRSGKDVVDGVYFYTCTVFERRLEGILQTPIVLSGYIHIVR